MKKLAVIFILFHYISAEVNENTGEMVLSQPLFTISGNTISLPINLGYTAGIKVDQRAGWVGLGFSMSLPYIERVPVGSADEKAANFLCNGSPASEKWFYSMKTFSKLIKNNFTNGYKFQPLKGDFTNQQDVYLLNAPFAGGRILFKTPSANNEEMVAYLQHWRPVRICYKINASDDIYEWDIIDANGTKYIFGGQQGILKVTANIDSYADNTAITRGASNFRWDQAKYIKTDGSCTGEACESWMPAIMPDHYVNSSFNRRWYLTEIQSPNYNAANGTGERITISYTVMDPQYKIRLTDLFYSAPVNDRAVTSLFCYRDKSTSYNHAIFTYGIDNYYINPIYPVEIVGPRGKARFIMSSSSTFDKLVQGDKRIDKIEIYSLSGNEYIKNKTLQFNYDPNGHCIGHPYASPNTGKGLLKLNDIKLFSADGGKTLPVVSFVYTSNPSFSGYYKHDVYGYYRNEELRRITGKFGWDQCQSSVGTSAAPGAEAWSVCRAIWGDGKIEEYSYETNRAMYFSTKDTFTTADVPMKTGIRVLSKKVYDGVSSTPKFSNYEYEGGYTHMLTPLSYKKAFVFFDTGHWLYDPTQFWPLVQCSPLMTNEVNTVYCMLNYQDYASVSNIMFLNSISVNYCSCKISTGSAGSVKKYFLNPWSSLPIYESNPVSYLSLADVRVQNSVSINSMAHYRGLEYRTEYYRQGTTTNPVSAVEKTLSIKYKLFSYRLPKCTLTNFVTCYTGGNGNYTTPELPDNQEYEQFIGFMRLSKNNTKTDSVNKIEEIVSYNNTNGQPKITRTANSDGKKLLTKTFFAFEDNAYATGMGVNGKYMLTAPCQTITYEKAPADNTTEPVAANVRSVQATMWSNALGCASWVPWKTFAWRSNFKPDGTIGKTNFTNFTFPTSETDTNWNLTGSVDKYDPSGIPIQTSDAYGVSSAVILSSDTKLPIATVANAKHGEVFFTSLEDPITFNFVRSGTTQNQIFQPSVSGLGKIGNKGALIHNMVATECYAEAPWTELSAGLSQAKKFIFSGWVLSTGPDVEIYFFASTVKGQYQAPNWSNVLYQKTAGDGWKFLKGEFTAPAGSRYFMIRVDNNGMKNGGTDVYFDDLKFYPADAMMNCTYYSPQWQLPILTVDANENPGRYVEYDDFGRVFQIWKITDKTKPLSDPAGRALLERKEYRLFNDPAPSALAATTVSGSQLNLSWTDNASNETKFHIERSATLGWGFMEIATVGANVKTYSNTGLTAGTTYYYRVRANTPNGYTGYSAEASGKTN